ncbi:MAG: hypothetical protein COV46_04350 [Deltaproteobacteria bacterium CG11_big_fil_rev_8_21_14_0_20_49_13]|nr:MAG: hypothetical protein COV46_04350 [Deltaproteobacteria bacterium CG11_big_fil_rev_8_21_14_0_20_49_13]
MLKKKGTGNRRHEAGSKNGFILLLASCLLFLFSSHARADVISETLLGEELMFERNYPAALELFSIIEKEYPDSPCGTFGQLATLQIMMFENLDFRFKDQYVEAEKRFERVAYKTINNNPTTWDLFILGAGYGMKGFYFAREGKWFRAVGSAVRATQLLKRAQFIDKTFVDSDLGIGMYNYWRSVLTKGLRFLPFFGDHTAEGIAAVENVIENGKYGKTLAEANMAFMLAREKRYDEARKILTLFLMKYPNNIILRQLSGDIYIDTKKYDKAAEEYKLIYKIDPEMTRAIFRLGRIYQKAGKNEESLKYYQQYLATGPEKDWEKATKAFMAQLTPKTSLR